MPVIMNKYKRNWSYGANAVISSVVFVGILVFVVLIVERHPLRVDLTEAGKYTLSEQTVKILDSVQAPVHIRAFYASAGQEQAQARDMLETYSYNNKNISYEFIDPDRQPEEARRYEVRSYGSLVLEGYQKSQTIQSDDEESITNAILKLMRAEEKKVYFLVGHGEHSLKDFDKEGYSNLQAALEKENYKTEELSLMQHVQVPEDAALLVIAGPQKPLLKEEIASLNAYLKTGGKVLALVDPFQNGGLQDFVKEYGLELREDIVIDKLSRVFGGSYLMPVVTQYGESKITENFGIATFYPEARSVRTIEKQPAGVHVTSLASTSGESWAETNIDLIQQGQADFDEKEDMAGPVSLAALAEISLTGDGAEHNTDASQVSQPEAEDADDAHDSDNGPKAFLAVFGDSNFADNTHFELSGNADLMLNTINFLAEEETLISIKSRDNKGRPLLLTQTQARVIFMTSMILVPLLVIAAGLTVYRVRRSQR
jgi:ABC-type uncharacterized transport system involved in gliding motility auxiliary subunit